MKTLALLVLLAIASSAPAQWFILRRDDQGMREIVRRPELYDALMVATALGPPIGRPLTGDPDLAVQRVRVEDSRAFSPGTIVDVYLSTPGGSMTDTYAQMGVPYPLQDALPVGRRVLLVARAARGALLIRPNLGTTPPDLPPAILRPGSGPSVYGERHFLTTQARLASAPDPRWRLLESLAAAIPGTGDDNADRIAAAVSMIDDLGNISPFGHPDDRYSRLFAGAVAHDTAYHRALVDYALNNLRYWGYGDRLFRDLQAAASEPNAFPDGLPVLEFEEQPGTGNNPELPKDFRHDPPLSQEAILAILRRAKSPTLAVGYLRGLAAKPAEPHMRSLARFLDSPAPRLRRAFVERLAAWSGEPAPAEPRESLDHDGRLKTEYPGLDAAVARWKARLRSAPKPG